MRRIRERIKAITAPRHRLPEPVDAIVTTLNQVLRGWGAYFRVGNSSRKFAQVDSYVRERLALFLSKKRQRSGRRWQQWSLTFFQSLGVYQLTGTSDGIRHRRQPRGERPRKAGCGRIACPV